MKSSRRRVSTSSSSACSSGSGSLSRNEQAVSLCSSERTHVLHWRWCNTVDVYLTLSRFFRLFGLNPGGTQTRVSQTLWRHDAEEEAVGRSEFSMSLLSSPRVTTQLDTHNYTTGPVTVPPRVWKRLHCVATAQVLGTSLPLVINEPDAEGKSDRLLAGMKVLSKY